MSVPAPPTQQMQAKIKCYASAYGSRFPHVAGYNEIFVPGYGFESSDGTTFIRPTRSGSGTLLDGDTGYPNTMIYASGYHGSVYQNDPLTGVENAILTLVHERGHQNGSDNEDVDDAAGYDAVKAYRADNNGAACSTKSDPNATK